MNRPGASAPTTPDQRLREDLAGLYGPTAGPDAFRRLMDRISRHAAGSRRPKLTDGFSQSDILLIAYPDQLCAAGSPPLRVLSDFCGRHLTGLVNGIHILPCFPSTSDDGFAVSDYGSVDPAFGTWDDISRLAARFDLMLDAVLNHTSARHPWFHAFLRKEDPGREYYIRIDERADLSRVVRPRDLPLAHTFGDPPDTVRVWTTFSADQVDLNYRNPLVLAEAVDILLTYAARGARYIRLDAAAFLWKEPGTACVHLPQTHRLIRIMRAALELAAPDVRLVTETNVPHADNISYWGDGGEEAQLVYNFTLPPLLLHTMQREDARALTGWAAGLSTPSPETTFLNFLASHDGIGLNPLRGILPEEEIDALVRRAVSHGGLVSLKKDVDGTQQPYELNINYFDALNHPAAGESAGLQADRFRTAHAILLALAGVPAIYFHSLFGSRGWREGPGRTGQNRAVNREKLDAAAVERELARKDSLRRMVFDRLAGLLRARTRSAAFSPLARQEVLDFGPHIFAVLRTGADGQDRVLCLHNITPHPAPVPTPLKPPGFVLPSASPALDLLSDMRYPASLPEALCLKPYETLWLTPPDTGPDRKIERSLPG